jgi:hypothetical protein
MNNIENIADELAQMVLADADNLDDNVVIDLMAAVISASSATLQEAFLTAIRIRRAELRAVAVLDKYNAKKKA